jgi:hypothetical protein
MKSEQLWQEYAKFKEAISKKKQITIEDFEEEYQKQRKVAFDSTIGVNMTIFEAICEIKIGEIVVVEFLEIFETRGGVEQISLPEATGLFMSLMWKNNFKNNWRSSPYILGLFYEEIVLKLYKEHISSELDHNIMEFLAKEYSDNRKINAAASIGKGFPTLSSRAHSFSFALHDIRRYSTSDNPVPHYLSVRLMEQMLDFVKDWLDQELAQDSPFTPKFINIEDPEAQADAEKKQRLRVRSAELISERVENFFVQEQVEYWQRNQENYSSMWSEEVLPTILTHTWDRQFNIFKKYQLGERLERDVDLEYLETIYRGGDLYEDGLRKDLPKGSKETLRQGTIITPMVLCKLLSSLDSRDKELSDLFCQASKRPAYFLISWALRDLSYRIEYMIGRQFDLNLMNQGDEELKWILLSVITTSAIIEYLRLVREDSTLNRITPGIGVFQEGVLSDERGRPIKESSRYFPGQDYLMSIYSGVSKAINGSKAEAKGQQEEKVLPTTNWSARLIGWLWRGPADKTVEPKTPWEPSIDWQNDQGEKTKGGYHPPFKARGNGAPETKDEEGEKPRIDQGDSPNDDEESIAAEDQHSTDIVTREPKLLSERFLQETFEAVHGAAKFIQSEIEDSKGIIARTDSVSAEESAFEQVQRQWFPF